MDDITICPLCQKTSFIFFAAHEHAGRKLQYRICRSCGLVLQSPQPDEIELERFYLEGYRTLYQGSEDPIKKDLVMQSARAKVSVEMIRPWIKSIRRHLDIGSSSGAFLQVVSNEFQNQAVGVEPGDAYRRFSEEQGLKIYSSIEQLIASGEAPFNLISMMHVLEHIKHPVDVLKDLRQHVLGRDGYLLIEVPNLYEHEAFEFAHLFTFTASTLKRIVRQAGYKVLWTKAHGGFRSPILNLNITLLAQVDGQSSSIRWLRPIPGFIRFRRKLGQWKRQFFTRKFPDWTWQSPRTLWEE